TQTESTKHLIQLSRLLVKNRARETNQAMWLDKHVLTSETYHTRQERGDLCTHQTVLMSKVCHDIMS
ncbi:hypothetical protein LSAT2_025324, partial [Lamellibrachia satsuma]